MQEGSSKLEQESDVKMQELQLIKRAPPPYMHANSVILPHVTPDMRYTCSTISKPVDRCAWK